MARRAGPIQRAAKRGEDLSALVLRELAIGRADRNLSGAVVGRAMGLSAAQYCRFERGLTDGVTIEAATVALAAVGLELALSVHPGGQPIRDAASARLIERLRGRCAPTIRLLTEVPLPDPGDPRAWDVVLLGIGWRHRFEVETRPTDRQALERRIALKARDSGPGGVSLLLLDSRHNRSFLRENHAALLERFPVPGSVALAALRAGSDPGAGSVILL